MSTVHIIMLLWTDNWEINIFKHLKKGRLVVCEMLFSIGFLDKVRVGICCVSIPSVTTISIISWIDNAIWKLIPVHDLVDELESCFQVLVESSVDHHIESVIVISACFSSSFQNLDLLSKLSDLLFVLNNSILTSSHLALIAKSSHILQKYLFFSLQLQVLILLLFQLTLQVLDLSPVSIELLSQVFQLTYVITTRVFILIFELLVFSLLLVDHSVLILSNLGQSFALSE